ncbi:hypothetical protein PHMEG_0007804 [Phytophthora megakarya]|uniref:Uncharacterized protein n=1 Tax=Phytophthora megakarya TaxID=4795 RepID=A0A225WMC9_9STRA|nr:hypothetical protein PHMEG_0007804 [Phytophthora megakarya]
MGSGDSSNPDLTHHPRDLANELDGSGESDTGGASKAIDTIGEHHKSSTAKDTLDPDADGDDGTSPESSVCQDSDEVLDDMLQALTLMALTRSRSEQRRRDHIAPGSAAAGGAGDPGSGDSSKASGFGNDDGGTAPPQNPYGWHISTDTAMLPQRPFAADQVCIPGRHQARLDPDHHFLPRALPLDPSWIFPGRVPIAVTTTTTDYCGHLITAPNVQALMAAKPAHIVRFRRGWALGLLVERYLAMKIQDLTAYWESTHRFLSPPILVRTDPYLATFCVERKNRRSHAGARWKVIMFLFIITMREGWCDMDLLLDSFIMHFPQRTNEVLWYPGIEAHPRLNRPEPITLIKGKIATTQIRGVLTSDFSMPIIQLVGLRVWGG